MRLVLIFLLLLVQSAMSQSLEQRLTGLIDIVVSTDGTGNVSSVQEAIDLAPANSTQRTVIFLRNGIYNEKITLPANKPNIVLIGQDADSVVLTWNDYSGREVNGNTIGTSTSFSFAADAADFMAMNLSFENSAGTVGQAVALRTNADRQVFYHCKFIGHQDTYYTWGHYRNYLNDCFIMGTTDYVFGRSTVFFDNCQLHSIKTGSYVTAASTEQNALYGYVFQNCRFTTGPNTSNVYLGRPWRPYARTVILNSYLSGGINAKGWSQWSGNDNHTTCFYAEYKNNGSGADTSQRVDWSHQLSREQAEDYTLENVFSKASNPNYFTNDWDPKLEEDILYMIVSRTVSPFLDSSNQSSILGQILIDGSPIDDFDKQRFIYNITLPYGTENVPEIVAVPENSRAQITKSLPNSLPGIAEIRVRSYDRTSTSTYRLNLSVEQESPVSFHDATSTEKPFFINNPFNDFIYIDVVEGLGHPLRFVLFDSMGRCVSRSIVNMHQRHCYIPAHSFPAGLYTYSLSMLNSQFTGSLVKL